MSIVIGLFRQYLNFVVYVGEIFEKTECGRITLLMNWMLYGLCKAIELAGISGGQNYLR